MTTRLSPVALEALRAAYYIPEVNRLLLPRKELPRQAYCEVKEVCARLGGHWNRASQAFLFAYDPTPALEIIRANGYMPPKNPYAHFQTPDAISEDMLRSAFCLFGCNLCDGYRHNQPLHDCQYLPAGLRILEPSAGKGAIARRVRQLYSSLGRTDYILHCCELDPINRAILQQQGFTVVAENFFDHRLKPGEAPYHIIIMNPPFQGLEFLNHLEHAWSLLDSQGGRLVFLAPTGLLWREDARCREFRKLLRIYGEEPPFIYPCGRFKESGTSIETVRMTLVKQDQSWRMLPYEGFPNWHCYMLDLFIAQTAALSDRQWHIWQKIDRGELPETSDHPAWSRTQQVLHEFFTDAIQQARSDWWVEIELDRASLRFMEQHVLKEGMLNCQCDRHSQARQHLFEEGHRQDPLVPAVTDDAAGPALPRQGSVEPLQLSLFSSFPKGK